MSRSYRWILLLGGVVASGMFLTGAEAQTAAQAPSTANAPATAPAVPYRNPANYIAKREAAYLEAMWGIADPSIKAVESGVILRFSFRVLDPEKAKTLNDKKLEPYLISPEKGLKLVIPEMEKVGKLRQTSTPEAGRSYWMAFSNSGRLLKRGDRVDIVIGSFQAKGLMIE